MTNEKFIEVSCVWLTCFKGKAGGDGVVVGWRIWVLSGMSLGGGSRGKSRDGVAISLRIGTDHSTFPTPYPLAPPNPRSRLNRNSSLQLVHARARRRFQRGLKRRPLGLIKKLRQAKKDAAANEKPAMVKTHLRDMIIVPEMIGSVVGVYVSSPRSDLWENEPNLDRTVNHSPLSRSSQK
jgi:hypothetical protein